MKQYNNTISVVKCIGIISMVIGHSGCPGALRDFIYLFHMPLFFIITGYFIKENKLEDYKSFTITKIKSLYVPFLFWNTLFLILHNTFFLCGIYDFQPERSEYYMTVVKNILFTGTSPMLNSLWFLKSLFIANMVLMILYKITSYFKLNYMIWGGISVLTLFLTGWALTYLGIRLPYDISRELMIPFIIFIGYIINKFKILDMVIKYPIYISLVILVILVFISHYISFDIAGAVISNPIAFIVISVISFITIYTLSYRLRGNRILTYIGENTLPILILHGLAFKIIPLIQVVIIGMNTTSILSVTRYHNNELWYLYSVVGIVVPIALNYMYKTVRAYI